MSIVLTIGCPPQEPWRQTLETSGFRILSLPTEVDPESDPATIAARLSAATVAEIGASAVLLSDQLPNEAIHHICRILKNTEGTQTLPVLLCCNGLPTTPETLESYQRASELGASGVFFTNMPEEASNNLISQLTLALNNKHQLDKAYSLAQELQTMNAELFERNTSVEKELYVARQLQQSLLPAFLKDQHIGLFSKCHHQDERLKITGLYLPCDALGGDLYDLIALPNSRLGMIVSDVCGHGVAASLVTAIFKSCLTRLAHTEKNPGALFAALNNELAQIVVTGDYITAVYANVQPDPNGVSCSVHYSGAGHPYPICFSKEHQTLSRLTENGPPLGWFADMSYPTGELTMQPGDKLFLFSDGITELRNPQGDMFGEEALEAFFLLQSQQQESYILESIVAKLSDFTQGHPLQDDMSMMLIEVL